MTLLYSIPTYQSYHSKKTHQKPEVNTQLYSDNNTTPQLHGGEKVA